MQIDNQKEENKNESIDRIGPFTFEKGSENTRAFAQMLYGRFLVNKDHLGLEDPTSQIRMEEVSPQQANLLVDLLSKSISTVHAAKFGIIVRGVFTTSQFDELPDLSQTSDLVLHGTDATRGTKVLSTGLKVPQQHAETKTDGMNPMYGVGICTSPLDESSQAAGKAMAYTNESGYSTSTPGEGPVFVLHPNKGKVYTAKSALWGNMIPDGASGKLVDWRDTYDSIEALPRGAGGDSTAANFPELTLKSADQAHPIAVLWVERVPVTDPRYAELGMNEKPVVNAIPIIEANSALPQTEDAPTVENQKPESPLAHFIRKYLSPESVSPGQEAVDLPTQTIAEEPTVDLAPDLAPDSDANEAHLIKEKLGVAVVEVRHAESISAAKISVRLDAYNPEGIEIGPGEAVLVNFPVAELKERTIRTVIIQHRLDPKRWYSGVRSPRRYQRVRPEEVRQTGGKTEVLRRGNPPSWFTLDPQVSYLVDKGGYFNERATNPPKTEVFIHDVATDQWISLGTKIAEPRPSSEPEEERIYDVQIPPGKFDRLILVGRGTGDPTQARSTLHSAELVFYPEVGPAPVSYQEHIFTKGVVFKDLTDPSSVESYRPTSNYGTSYGYPNAVEVGGHRDQPRSTYPEELLNKPGSELARIQDGLGVALKPGKTVSLVEIACGDTVFGKTPGGNKSGWAELQAKIINTEGEVKAFVIDGEAVPPYGILSGAADTPYITQPGDRLAVSSDAHPAWIMGIRIQYT